MFFYGKKFAKTPNIERWLVDVLATYGLVLGWCYNQSKLQKQLIRKCKNQDPWSWRTAAAAQFVANHGGEKENLKNTVLFFPDSGELSTNQNLKKARSKLCLCAPFPSEFWGRCNVRFFSGDFPENSEVRVLVQGFRESPDVVAELIDGTVRNLTQSFHEMKQNEFEVRKD